MNNNYFAKIKENRSIILSHCPLCQDVSGIYILTREEDGFKYAYIGQAVRVLSRLAQHLSGFQHIDLSLRKHGFYPERPNGWKISWFQCEEAMLDEREQEYIRIYANAGYQLRNKTSGGQGDGKSSISDEPRKGYREGLNKGYENARKEVARWFKLHLDFSVKKPGNKVQEKAKQKFEEFIDTTE